jgi:hypothetical protein
MQGNNNLVLANGDEAAVANLAAQQYISYLRGQVRGQPIPLPSPCPAPAFAVPFPRS